MSSCAAIIGRQRTKITTSSPWPSPTLFYHCLLVLLLSLHYFVCLWRHLCQSWPDTATGLKRSITWVNNSTNGCGYKLPGDWNRPHFGQTPPWCDSSDIVCCSAGRSPRGHSHGLLSVLVPYQTQWSAPAGPVTVVPEQFCFFTEMQCSPGAFIVPEPVFHQCPMKRWTSWGVGLTANPIPVISSTTISPEETTHTQTK